MGFLIFAVLLSPLMAGLTEAFGQVVVRNYCPFNVYIHTVTTNPGFQSITANLAQGQNFSEPYQWTDIGGVSMKFALGDALNEGRGQVAISQFEYTMIKEYGKPVIYYNLSDRDCRANCPGSSADVCPFEAHGYMVESGHCQSHKCHAGEVPCHDAYNTVNDHWANNGCPLHEHNHDTIVTLCHEYAHIIAANWQPQPAQSTSNWPSTFSTTYAPLPAPTTAPYASWSVPITPSYAPAYSSLSTPSYYSPWASSPTPPTLPYSSSTSNGSKFPKPYTRIRHMRCTYVDDDEY